MELHNPAMATLIKGFTVPSSFRLLFGIDPNSCGDPAHMWRLISFTNRQAETVIYMINTIVTKKSGREYFKYRMSSVSQVMIWVFMVHEEGHA